MAVATGGSGLFPMASGSKRHTGCRIRELLVALTLDDLRRVLDAMPAHHLAHLQRTLGMAATGRAARRMAATLLSTRIRRADHDAATEIAALLTNPVSLQLDDLVEDPAEPTETTITTAIGRWDVRLVVLTFHTLWEMGEIDAAVLERLCGTVERIAT